jgi:hypothetical protein
MNQERWSEMALLIDLRALPRLIWVILIWNKFYVELNEIFYLGIIFRDQRMIKRLRGLKYALRGL